MARVFKRQGAYWIDFNDGQGVRHRRKIGPDRRIAAECLNGILGQIARREYLGVIEDSPVTFAAFADQWLDRIKHRLKPATEERWRGILDKHLKLFFRGSLRSVTVADAERYVKARVEAGASPSSVNRETTVLKNLMRRAVEWEFRSRNPFLDGQGRPLAGVRALQEPPGRVRFLDPEETERLLSACRESLSPYLYAFVVTALNTGMRRNEILSLSRQTVDFQNRVATVLESKNGDARRVHLNDTAYDALRSLPARLDGRLFPLQPHQVTMLFVRAAKRAGIENFRLHDLRHCFASAGAMAGIQARGLQALLGHKDGRMTQRYSHLSDQYLRNAVNLVEAQLGGGQPKAPKKESDVG